MNTRPSASSYAWTVVALLWPVALLNYLDRQMLAAMKFSVMHDIPSIGSEAHWGFLPRRSSGCTLCSVPLVVTSRTDSAGVR
jgi:hypothetical protein